MRCSAFWPSLNKLLDECEPQALCVTFDRKAPTFRHLAYEGYKATRKGMPDELASQMPILKEVLAALNIPMYELDGWEADDLIGTISVKDTAAGWETVVVTGDKDSLQLVTETTTVKLVSTRMGRTATRDMTPETFQEEYGFGPIHIIDLKALMGDASDNIPGVKGVGRRRPWPWSSGMDPSTCCTRPCRRSRWPPAPQPSREWSKAGRGGGDGPHVL